MNSDVALIANTLFYSGHLHSDADVANARLSLPQMCEQRSPWLLEALRPERSVVFADTTALGVRAQECRPSGAVENPFEVRLCSQLVLALTAAGLPSKDILVLSPYRQQLRALQAALGSQFDVLTIDKSQGQSVRCVIVSLVHCNSEGQVGELLCDWHRLNVALTRAKHKLILLGSLGTLMAPQNPHNPVQPGDGRQRLLQLMQLCKSRDWVVTAEGGS